MMTSMTTVAVNKEDAIMNVNIIGNKVFVNGSPYVNGYEYRNGRWKRTLRTILHAMF